MVDPARHVQLRHLADDCPIGVRRRTDDELHGHPGRAPRPELVPRPTISLFLSSAVDERPCTLERLDRRREALVRCDPAEALAAGRLEVYRDAAREGRDPLDLRVLGAGYDLDVDVAAKAVSLAQQFQHAYQVVHHLDRATRDSRRDEQPLAPTPLPRCEKDADELLRLEKRPRHLAIAAHRAVVAVEAARVGHEDPQQRSVSPAIAACADSTDVERPQRRPDDLKERPHLSGAVDGRGLP
jgi:hypothetical protein